VPQKHQAQGEGKQSLAALDGRLLWQVSPHQAEQEQENQECDEGHLQPIHHFEVRQGADACVDRKGATHETRIGQLLSDGFCRHHEEDRQGGYSTLCPM
jgi:hypothetical protein